MDVSLFAAMSVISLPHILYAYIWTNPKGFMKKAKSISKKSDPCDLFASMAGMLKICQFSAFGLWYILQGSLVDFSSISMLTWLIATVLIVAGQALNIGIYAAVGKAGVYYGCKLGKKIPWCSGFPFNVVDHPQYVGSSMTVWGIFMLLYTPAHAFGLIILSIYVTGLYTITGIIEAKY